MTEHDPVRKPYAVQVEFRTPSSFLVAYSVNLSRGCLFVETDADIPTGAGVTLDLGIPSAEPISLHGMVSWRRGADAPDGPPGLGVELTDVAPQLGSLVDRLVSSFNGVQILVLSGDRQDRASLSRSIKSIIGTADVMQAADANVAATLMSGELDLAVVDIDFDAEGGLATLRAAKGQRPAVPAVALTANAKLHEHARAAGADEILANPPPFAELQVVLVRALSKPAAVRGGGG